MFYAINLPPLTQYSAEVHNVTKLQSLNTPSMFTYKRVVHTVALACDIKLNHRQYTGKSQSAKCTRHMQELRYVAVQLRIINTRIIPPALGPFPSMQIKCWSWSYRRNKIFLNKAYNTNKIIHNKEIWHTLSWLLRFGERIVLGNKLKAT